MISCYIASAGDLSLAYTLGGTAQQVTPQEDICLLSCAEMLERYRRIYHDGGLASLLCMFDRTAAFFKKHVAFSSRKIFKEDLLPRYAPRNTLHILRDSRTHCDGGLASVLRACGRTESANACYRFVAAGDDAP